MIVPPKPENEQMRLAFLKKLNLLDTPIEERYERITRMVCLALGVPIAAICLLDEERQWFKSIQGVAIPETARDIAFCAHAINDITQPLVVNDASHDERFHDNPLVTGFPGIRFYAGCPLIFEDGLAIGSLCAIDTIPRELSADQMSLLSDLANMLMSEISTMALSDEHQKMISELQNAERAALTDPLTRIWNRAGGEALLRREWSAAERSDKPIGLALLDIDHFKSINDANGHDAGDGVIRQTAQTVLTSLRPYDIITRWGGEEFLIVLPGCSEKDLGTVLERVMSSIHAHPAIYQGHEIPFTVSIGACSVFPGDAISIEAAIKVSDLALYEAKGGGRDRVVISTVVQNDKKSATG